MLNLKVNVKAGAHEINASACLQIVVHTSVTNMGVCLKHGCVTAWVSRGYLGEYSVIRNDATIKYRACACIRVCMCAYVQNCLRLAT